MEHWRETYNKRSYCDLNLIGNDLYSGAKSAGYKAYETSSRAANVAATEADRQGRVLYEKLGVASEEVKKTSKVAYEKSSVMAKEQYDKHWPTVEPHYNEHVAPLVAKFYAWKEAELDPRYKDAMAQYREFKAKELDPRLEQATKALQDFKNHQMDPRIEEFKAESKKQFQNAAKMYAQKCKQAVKIGNEFAREHELDFFETSIAPYMTESCQHPEESITYFMYAGLCVFAYFLRRRILGLIWSIVKFVWGWFVALTPLRFFVSRKKAATSEETPVAEPNKTVSDPNVVRVKKKASVTTRISQ